MVLNEERVNPHAVNTNGLGDLKGGGTPSHEHDTLTGLTLLSLDNSCRDSLQNSSREGFPALL